MEKRSDYWQKQARDLFYKMGKLKYFEYHVLDGRLSCYDPNIGESHNYYTNVYDKEGYKDLEDAIYIELQLCYRNLKN